MKQLSNEMEKLYNSRKNSGRILKKYQGANRPLFYVKTPLRIDYTCYFSISAKQ